MKKLLFLLSPDLQEDGTLLLRLGREAELIMKQLDDSWSADFLVRNVAGKQYEAVPSCIRLLMDQATPAPYPETHLTRIQSQISRWQGLPAAAIDQYDCAIALGFDPWAIATLTCRIHAKRKLLYLHRALQHYVGQADEAFFRSTLNHIDGVLCSTQENADAAARMLNGAAAVVKIAPPVDIARFATLAEEDIDVDMEDDCVNLIAVYAPENEAWMEHIPLLAAKLRHIQPELRWYILGRGKRYERLQHNIICHDVWQEVIPLDDTENIYPYLRQGDIYLLLPGEGENLRVKAARAMQKSITSLHTANGELVLPSGKLHKAAPLKTLIPWKDMEYFINVIEGVKAYEDC